MKRYTIGLTILLALMNTGCEDKKDDEFSLNGTWLSIFGKMDGSNEPVVFFDTDNKILQLHMLMDLILQMDVIVITLLLMIIIVVTNIVQAVVN